METLAVGSRTAGGQAEAATSQEAAQAQILADQVADGPMVAEMEIAEDLPLVAQEVPEVEGAQEVPEMEEAQEVREEEVAPLMIVMMTGGEGAATMRTSRKSSAGSWLFRSSKPGEGLVLIEKRSESAIEARPSQSRSRQPSRRTSSGSCWHSRKRCERNNGIIERSGSSSKRQ